MAAKRSTKVGKDSKQQAPKEPVWTYRGSELRASELSPAMGQLFSVGGQRASTLRQRLDTTTNWAIVSTGATLSVAFSQPEVHHGIIIINALLVLWFLSIESRRYRNYEMWNHRVRQMETDFYMPMLIPPFHPSSEQLDSLTENLLVPHYPISIWEAFGRRLRRHYLLIFFVIFVSWVAKIWLFPAPATSLDEFFLRSAAGPVAGKTIVILGLIFYITLALLAIATSPLMQVSAKMFPNLDDESSHLANSMQDKSKGLRAWLATRLQRSKCRALIITSRVDTVSTRIITDLRQNVTAMSGKSMYIGSGRTVLVCTLTLTEVQELKSAVAKEDPQAFVIVSPDQGILRRVFNPLEEE